MCTTLLITTNISSAPFQATAFVAEYLSREHHNTDDSKEIVIVSNPIFSWMFKNAFGLRYTYLDAGGARDLSNFEKAIFVIDNPLKRAMNTGDILNTSNQSDSLPDDMRTIRSYEEGSSGRTIATIHIRVCVKIFGQTQLKLRQLTSSIDQSIQI